MRWLRPSFIATTHYAGHTHTHKQELSLLAISFINLKLMELQIVPFLNIKYSDCSCH